MTSCACWTPPSMRTTVVLAHSMGTQVALEMYRRAPERMRGSC